MTNKQLIQVIHDLNKAVRQKYEAVGMGEMWDGQPLAHRARAAMRHLDGDRPDQQRVEAVVTAIRDLAVKHGSIAQQSRYWNRVDKYNMANPVKAMVAVNGLAYALGYEDALMNIDRCYRVPEDMDARLTYADGARQAREDMR